MFVTPINGYSSTYRQVTLVILKCVIRTTQLLMFDQPCWIMLYIFFYICDLFIIIVLSIWCLWITIPNTLWKEINHAILWKVPFGILKNVIYIYLRKVNYSRGKQIRMYKISWVYQNITIKWKRIHQISKES